MSNASMQFMDNYDNAVIIRGANGRKIGEIRAWTTIGDYEDKSWKDYTVDDLGWMKFGSPSFDGKNEEAIINWAWMQVCSSADDLAAVVTVSSGSGVGSLVSCST